MKKTLNLFKKILNPFQKIKKLFIKRLAILAKNTLINSQSLYKRYGIEEFKSLAKLVEEVDFNTFLLKELEATKTKGKSLIQTQAEHIRRQKAEIQTLEQNLRASQKVVSDKMIAHQNDKNKLISIIHALNNNQPVPNMVVNIRCSDVLPNRNTAWEVSYLVDGRLYNQTVIRGENENGELLMFELNNLTQLTAHYISFLSIDVVA